MGYSYDGLTGKLCCDICGSHENARKYKCPFGYCQPTAACPSCREKRDADFRAKNHLSCQMGHLRYEQNERREKELLAAGEAVRCSALGVVRAGVYVVHVLFQKANRQTIGYYMDKDVYESLPLVEPHTPADYRKFGTLIEAPADFYTKEVSL